jgi:hypothetical protein
MMKCKECKHDKDCKAKSKANWTYGMFTGQEVTGCDKGQSNKNKE